MFHQVEGLAIGHNITMADLKGVIVKFANQLSGAGRKLRFRCSHFPFTEPSVEADVNCILCDGKGCGVCKYTGWLEIMGTHGTSGRPPQRRLRPRRVVRLRFWHGTRTDHHAQARDYGHPVLLWERLAVLGAVWIELYICKLSHWQLLGWSEDW